jgi:exopolysaccharide production protein ExoQ
MIAAKGLRPGCALAGAGLLMPPLATLAPLSLAPLLAVAAVGALALGGYRELWRLDGLRALVVMLALLGLLGAASALWSIIPLHSALEGLRFLLICAAGLALIAAALGLDDAERERATRWFLWGFVIGLVILSAAAILSAFWSPSRAEGGVARWLRHFTVFDRGATTLALALWPALLILSARGKRWAIAALILVTLAVVLALKSRTAMLCLVMALALWPIAHMAPRACGMLIAAGLVVLVATFPTLPLTMDAVVRMHQAVPRLDNSAIHRFAIWHFAIDRIAERPFLGWGLDASRALPGGSDLVDDPRLPEIAAAGGPWMPLHPHNAALQWRLELGLPGAALATLAVLWILGRVSSPGVGPPATRAAALALIAAALVVAMLSYGFWQAWWQSSLWLIAALAIVAAPRPSRMPAEP